MCYKQMIGREEQQRNLGDWRLVVSLTPLKLTIRAYDVDSEDYLFTEFRVGSLPADLADFYEDQDILFRVLISEQGVRVHDQKLYIPYSKIRLGKTVKKQFMISLEKVQGNEVAKLRNEVSRLSAEVERLVQLQEKVKIQDKFIQLLSEACQIYLYSPGQIISLQFPQIPENSLYRLRGRYLYKKQEKVIHSNNHNGFGNNFNSHGHSSYPSNNIRPNKLLGYPIDNSLNIFTYQVTIHSGSGSIFIGLARKYQEKNNLGQTSQKIQFLMEQKQVVDQFSRNRVKYMVKKDRACNYYVNLYSENKKSSNTSANKGDIFALTVNLLQKTMTWFKNGVSIERSYYTCSDPIIYPFISLDNDMEVII